jgi:hypothetical protein
MNNKKLALAVIAVLLVAGLIGAGIMAWFTSEQAIVGNLFEAGTLVIELDEETPAEALMKFENMQPGDVEEATPPLRTRAPCLSSSTPLSPRTVTCLAMTVREARAATFPTCWLLR